MNQTNCPRCGNKNSWAVRRHKRKCATCKYEWQPQKLPLQISRVAWQRLIRRFLAWETVAANAKEIKLGRGQVLRAFGIIRTAMSLDTPGELPVISNGSREPALVYIGQFDNYLVGRKTIYTDRNPIASLDGVCVLVYQNNRVWGRLISGKTGKDLEKIMETSAHSTISWSPILDGYTAVITKTHLYLLNHEGKPQGSIPEIVCHTIWANLKTIIAEKHGVRREQLLLYLGEVIWRSNFEALGPIEQEKRILSRLQEKLYKTKATSSALKKLAT